MSESFSTNSGTSGTSDFMDSNSLVAKFAFLLLVIFGFIVLLRIGIAVVVNLFKPTESPHLIDGMIDATQQMIFYQDSSGNDDVTTIYRSINQDNGLEFTWSVWIKITNFQYLSNRYRQIFYKGNDSIGTDGLNFPSNAPGLYITPDTNALLVIMNTYNVISEEIIIPDIPINKWLNIIIRCQNTTLNVYINGTIARSIQLHGVPKQNYGNVYVAGNGGFQGNISDLWYYNYAIGTAEIQKIVSHGPNDSPIDVAVNNITNTDYLSLRWYFASENNPYVLHKQS